MNKSLLYFLFILLVLHILTKQGKESFSQINYKNILGEIVLTKNHKVFSDVKIPGFSLMCLANTSISKESIQYGKNQASIESITDKLPQMKSDKFIRLVNKENSCCWVGLRIPKEKIQVGEPVIVSAYIKPSINLNTFVKQGGAIGFRAVNLNQTKNYSFYGLEPKQWNHVIETFVYTKKQDAFIILIIDSTSPGTYVDVADLKMYTTYKKEPVPVSPISDFKSLQLIIDRKIRRFSDIPVKEFTLSCVVPSSVKNIKNRTYKYGKNRLSITPLLPISKYTQMLKRFSRIPSFVNMLRRKVTHKNIKSDNGFILTNRENTCSWLGFRIPIMPVNKSVIVSVWIKPFSTIRLTKDLRKDFGIREVNLNQTKSSSLPDILKKNTWYQLKESFLYTKPIEGFIIFITDSIKNSSFLIADFKVSTEN